MGRLHRQRRRNQEGGERSSCTRSSLRSVPRMTLCTVCADFLNMNKKKLNRGFYHCDNVDFDAVGTLDFNAAIAFLLMVFDNYDLGMRLVLDCRVMCLVLGLQVLWMYNVHTK